MALTWTPRRWLAGTRSGAYVAPTDLLAERHHWSSRWRAAAIGCGLSRAVHVAAGVTDTVPRLTAVTTTTTGAPALVVELLPGQLPELYRERTAALALALDAGHVRVLERSGRHLALHLLPADPLTPPFDLAPDEPDGFLGIDEDGHDVELPWALRGHTVVQGQTGSGKSVFTYGALAALAGRRDIQVVGIDPTGLLWRPWAGLPGADRRVSGLADGLTEHRRVLRELCQTMDDRLASLPPTVDTLAPSTDTPLLVVVLEEAAGLYRAADLADRKIGAEVRGLVARLAAEGRKVAVRLLILLQRADTTVLDGAVRAQAVTRLTFAADADALAMLHPRRSVDADAHALARPGIAVLTHPVRGTLRLRAGALDYASYVDRVTAAR